MHLNVYKHMTAEALTDLLFACEAAMNTRDLTPDEYTAVEADRDNIQVELHLKGMTTEALTDLLFAREAAMEAGGLAPAEYTAIEADRDNIRAELYWGRGVYECDLNAARAARQAAL